MLGTVFYFILNMSVASCFVIAALLLVRQVRRLPRRVVYPLWSLAFFRLLVPFSLSTGWSLFNFTGNLVKRLITVEPSSMPLAEPFRMSAMNSIGAAEQYVPIEYKTETLRQIFTAASAVWATTAAAILLAAAILYMLTKSELKKAVRVEGNIYRSEMLLSPVLSGLLHPKIILPDSLGLGTAEGQMILAHEKIHMKRHDNLWRLLGIAAACLHWFNPFAWIMLKSFFTDMELSCDESVVKKYSTEERKTYASALLRFAEDKRVLVSSAFGQGRVKVRIVNALNYRKLTLFGVVASSIFVFAVALVLVTNPQIGG
ncbi:MAG: M56 family metallopeptidase [Clostridiales bacterium]|nr:M56 family metallopeptidase [Clostridiales bacterium]